MKKVTIQQAETQLAELLRDVEAGEDVIICRGQDEIARLSALAPRQKELRKLGLLKGRMHLPDSFFEPLPPGYDGFPDES